MPYKSSPQGTPQGTPQGHQVSSSRKDVSETKDWTPSFVIEGTYYTHTYIQLCLSICKHTYTHNNIYIYESVHS